MYKLLIDVARIQIVLFGRKSDQSVIVDVNSKRVERSNENINA